MLDAATFHEAAALHAFTCLPMGAFLCAAPRPPCMGPSTLNVLVLHMLVLHTSIRVSFVFAAWFAVRSPTEKLRIPRTLVPAQFTQLALDRRALRRAWLALYSSPVHGLIYQ